MVDTCLGVVHWFALVRLAQSGQFPDQVSTSDRVLSRAKSVETCPEPDLSSSEIGEAAALCARAHSTPSDLSIEHDVQGCQLMVENGDLPFDRLEPDTSLMLFNDCSAQIQAHATPPALMCPIRTHEMAKDECLLLHRNADTVITNTENYLSRLASLTLLTA
jgi:hypothetical protein